MQVPLSSIRLLRPVFHQLFHDLFHKLFHWVDRLRAHPPSSNFSSLTVIEHFRASDGVDGAVACGREGAIATCKTEKNAVSHKRPHRKKKTEERTTKRKLQ